MLDAFLDWASAAGISLYPAQEEAILEIMEGNHVVLNTPTGSGKSLVATAMHFRALCLGLRSIYTSPIKALVSEKFFECCRAVRRRQRGHVHRRHQHQPRSSHPVLHRRDPRQRRTARR